MPFSLVLLVVFAICAALVLPSAIWMVRHRHEDGAQPCGKVLWLIIPCGIAFFTAFIWQTIAASLIFGSNVGFETFVAAVLAQNIIGVFSYGGGSAY